ncbi:MAG: cytochrome c peroxidase [Chromatiales bacterium]
MALSSDLARGADISLPDGTKVPDIGKLPPVPANPDNRPSEARIALGRALFFDNRISASGTMNCATCHLPHQGWTVQTPLSPANPGRVERRNSPTLINVGYNKALIWDGRAWPLEKQAIGSTKNPIHKGQDIDKLMAVFNQDPVMVEAFQKAYGSKPNPTDYGRALAVFQRHVIVTGPSPFDRYLDGDETAMDAAAIRGMAIFKGKGGCMACHNGPNFTDSGFYNIGLKHNPMLDDPAHQEVLQFDAKRTKNTDWQEITTDPGRYLITHQTEDWGRFKTPTLRNLADTLPYMHDGRYRTLTEVIEHYDRGGDQTRNQDPRIKPLGLSDQEKQDLEAFLLALRGPLPDIRMQDWVRPVDGSAGLDGKTLFEGKATCVNCHQADGQGVPGVFPPLAGNNRVTEGDGSFVAKTILHGRSGRIHVNGKTFNAIMPPIGTQQGLSDGEVAAVASYVRSAWGNNAKPVTEAVVRQQR